MLKYLGRLFCIALLLPALGAAQNHRMTPTSGIDFNRSLNRISIGVETFFTRHLAVPNISIFKAELPPANFKGCRFTGIWMYSASMSLRPAIPRRGLGLADGLFRIKVGPSPNIAQAFTVFSVILKATWEPQNIIAPGFFIPVNPGATWLFVEFQEAGPGLPVNMELQATGNLNTTHCP